MTDKFPLTSFNARLIWFSTVLSEIARYLLVNGTQRFLQILRD